MIDRDRSFTLDCQIEHSTDFRSIWFHHHTTSVAHNTTIIAGDQHALAHDRDQNDVCNMIDHARNQFDLNAGDS